MSLAQSLLCTICNYLLIVLNKVLSQKQQIGTYRSHLCVTSVSRTFLYHTYVCRSSSFFVNCTSSNKTYICLNKYCSIQNKYIFTDQGDFDDIFIYMYFEGSPSSLLISYFKKYVECLLSFSDGCERLNNRQSSIYE